MYNGSLPPVSSLLFLQKAPHRSLETEAASPRETTGKARAPRRRRRLQQRCTACLPDSTARGSRARARFWFGRAREGVCAPASSSPPHKPIPTRDLASHWIEQLGFREKNREKSEGEDVRARAEEEQQHAVLRDPGGSTQGGAAGGGREMGSGAKRHFFPLTSLQIGWYTLIDDAKIMKRWEFDSVNQASSLITSWFSGSYYECQLLQDYLNNISPKGDVFYDAQNNFLTTEWDSENSQSDDGDYGHVQCKPPCSGPYKRRKITRSDAGSSMSEESYSEVLKLSDEWKIGVPTLAVHGRVGISRRA